MTMMTVCMHHQLSVLRVILISILFITIMMTLRTLKCFQIIEHRRARPKKYSTTTSFSKQRSGRRARPTRKPTTTSFSKQRSGRRARPSPKPKPKPTSTDAEAIARKLSEHYYTKAQADEKIDKIEQTIRIISKNADKYIQRIARDLYK